MKPLFALLIVLTLCCGCSKKTSPVAKPSTSSQSREVQLEEPEIKGATPEDPGPTTTVAGPLSAWQREAKSTEAQSKPVIRRESQPIDHAPVVDAGMPKHFLHSMFAVNRPTEFAFQVPPRQSYTRLRGTFQSFTKRNDTGSSDRAANVDLVLLNEQEFNEFLHGPPQSVTYELNSAHNEVVDWRVPTTYGEPETYHLVFSNSGGAKTKFVQADFTISFNP
jgi:hypothetical protein